MRCLPRESATVRRQLGEAADWGLTEHLMATLVDQGNARIWQAAGKKNLPKPKPVQRPGQRVKGAARSTLTKEERSARVLNFMERRQAELAKGGGDGG